MSYRGEIPGRIQRMITSWNLPDSVLVDVYLRLNHELPGDPMQQLVRVSEPFDGMVYPFSLIDPTNCLCEHTFIFLVLFSQDEERLVVANGAYLRTVGW